MKNKKISLNDYSFIAITKSNKNNRITCTISNNKPWEGFEAEYFNLDKYDVSIVIKRKIINA